MSLATNSVADYAFSSEADFDFAMKSHIAQTWKHRQESILTTRAGHQIHWMKLTHSSHTKLIVLVNGRIESYLKYQELIYDLYALGYDVVSFDHRGQGLSERLTDDPHLGHIHRFDDYVKDMHLVLSQIEIEQYQDRHILAHSMGGTIATRYLQSYSDYRFDSLILSAPMFGIAMPWYLSLVAKPLAWLLNSLQPSPSYAPGHGPYYAKPFSINPLTRSETRYRWFRNLYQSKPELQLGGPSAGWVYQALSATQDCFDQMESLSTPVLLLQAEQDMIVSNRAQTHFFHNLVNENNSKLMRLKGAYHEILFEGDMIRDKCLATMADWCETVENRKNKE